MCQGAVQAVPEHGMNTISNGYQLNQEKGDIRSHLKEPDNDPYKHV